MYVLGMSHVSKRSVEDIKQLIQHVKPEVAVIELCRDRVGLLVPRKSQIKYTQVRIHQHLASRIIPRVACISFTLIACTPFGNESLLGLLSRR